MSNLLISQDYSTKVRGILIEAQNKQPVEFANVVMRELATETLITGETSAHDGSFEMETTATGFSLEISFIGYKTKTITEFNKNNGIIDLGEIMLTLDSETLDEVIVRAEKSQTEFKLDKRVFNVGKDLSSTGASVLEVLNNVPSVTVNIEGAISLRGSSGVQILINGKPSVLASEQGNALGSITADMIDRIEVITNPSAKYEAEGTSGIINIIMKKNEKRGINGSLSLNTGIPDNQSIGFSVNRRTEKFNLFSQLGVGYRSMPREQRTINTDLERDVTIISTGESFRDEAFVNFNLGADYYINENNVITLAGNYAYEWEENPSRTDFERYEGNILTDRWFREEETTAGNPKWQYELNYKKQFTDHEDHALIFSALGREFSKDQSSDFNNTTISGSQRNNQQQTRTDFGEVENTIKLDYTHPINDKFTLESGAQYVLKDVGNDFAVDNNVDGEWINIPEQTNIFEYKQGVLGLYSTFSYEGAVFGVKGGLRMEYTDLNTLLRTTNEENNQEFTNFFPSLHTSYKLSERASVQAGYSKRILRPRLWSLNPFFNIRDNFNVRTGNPDLLPEFTDSYEFTAIYILPNISMNLGVYHRYTTDVVEDITTFDNNISKSFPLNIGTNRATGVEFNAKYTPGRIISFNGDFNFNYFKREGSYEGSSFDFNANMWTSRLTSKVKLPGDFDIEISGNYRSDFQTFQSKEFGFATADAGIRKKILKGKVVLNFSVRDAFASGISRSEINQPSFSLLNRGFRGRFFTLGMSYGFGKGEAMEFSGQRRH
jgi:outer membrane receptor protein involved in Fe transport